MRPKFDQYVHDLYDKSGNLLGYVVAEWNEAAGQYQRPMDKRGRELTGCHTEFAKKLDGFGGYYRDRRKALRRARYLFGNND